MRIVIVTFGGYAYYPYLFIKSILDREDQVLVFAPKKQKAEFIEIVGREERFLFFHKPRMRYPANLWTINAIVDSIEAFKPDIVHLLEYYPWMYFSIKRLSKFPIILTVHNPIKHTGDILTNIVPGSEALFYKYTSQIITLGQRMKELIIEKYGVDESKINVIHHGNYFLYLKWAKEHIVEKGNSVLFFGRIYGYKGLEYLVQAEPIISKEIPDVQFVIAGTGSKQYLKKIKEKITHPERFLFLNEYIPDERAVKLFQEASLVALPYVDGTQSGPLLMSYAFKKPVVVTNVGSIPEYVEDGKTGFIVPPRDVGKIAERIITLFKDVELRKKMGENAYRKSKEEFSWDKVGELAIEVYKKAHMSKK